MSRWNVSCLALVLLAGVWQLTTLRPGHDWGDDFALYLCHARNLAEGTPYADTGYLYNPAFASLSPRTYPPVLPLLAAPVYRCFGLEFTAFKVLMVGLFVLFLLATFVSVRRELPPAWVAGLLLLLGLHPYLWDYKDRVVSEVPFLFFTVVALALLGRLREGALGTVARLGLATLAGLAVYLACGTRTAGVALVPCVLLQDCARGLRGRQLLSWRAWQAPGLVSAVVLGVFILGVAIQKTFLVVEGSYLDQLTFDPQLFLRNFVSLLKAMSLFFENGYSGALRVGLYAVLSAFALVGYGRCVWRGPGAREFFVPAYFALVVAWPCSEWGARFLLPLLPLYLLYVCHGLLACEGLAAWARWKPLAGATAALLLLVTLGCYAGQYSRQSFGPLPGVGEREARGLFDYVCNETAADSVFLCQKPRALALFTRRQASAHHRPGTDAELWQYLEKIGATHVVVGKPWEDFQVLGGFAARNGDRLEVAYQNPQFTVYSVRQTTQAARADR